MRRWALAVAMVRWGAGCSPAPAEPGGVASEATDPATTATGSSSATTGTTAAADTTGMATTTGTTTTTATGTTSATSGGTQPWTPPNVDQCEPVWLIGPSGLPMPNAWSGFVQCDDPYGGWQRVALRVEAVSCPWKIGDECRVDADCPTGSACICADEMTPGPGVGLEVKNRCLPTDCGSASDCGGFLCRVDSIPCLNWWVPAAVRCTTASDDCMYNSTCAGAPWGFCDYDEIDELFTCEPGLHCE
jgi:hypothetical protein